MLAAGCIWLSAAAYCQETFVTGSTSADTGGLVPALKYINGNAFLKEGLTGKNVKIGIVDVGFQGANRDPRLRHFFNAKKVMGTKDFIYPEKHVMFDKQTDMDWHGTSVWCYIGGKDPNGGRYGLATDASYYLARTDDGAKEYRREQEYFRNALDWLHSCGVRVVNVSLGYAYGFDDPAENYVPDSINGKTTAITRAAEEAAVKYNMIIVVAAGNDGDNPWRIISAPADAREVIAVGASDISRGKKNFSAEGPDFLPYLKPNISCLNDTGGTSFSAPVIAGVIACMLQKRPELSNDQIINIIERSGHLYPYGNNYEGYGVPDAEKILKLMKDSTYDFRINRRIEATADELLLPVQLNEKDWVLFHKKDNWIVLEQKMLKPEGAYVRIQRPARITKSKMVVDDKITAAFHIQTTMEKVMYTTVVTGKEIIEISWP